MNSSSKVPNDSVKYFEGSWVRARSDSGKHSRRAMVSDTLVDEEENDDADDGDDGGNDERHKKKPALQRKVEIMFGDGSEVACEMVNDMADEIEKYGDGDERQVLMNRLSQIESFEAAQLKSAKNCDVRFVLKENQLTRKDCTEQANHLATKWKDWTSARAQLMLAILCQALQEGGIEYDRNTDINAIRTDLLPQLILCKTSQESLRMFAVSRSNETGESGDPNCTIAVLRNDAGKPKPRPYLQNPEDAKLYVQMARFSLRAHPHPYLESAVRDATFALGVLDRGEKPNAQSTLDVDPEASSSEQESLDAATSAKGSTDSKAPTGSAAASSSKLSKQSGGKKKQRPLDTLEKIRFDAHYLRSRAHLLLQQYNLAADDIKKAVLIDPRNEDARKMVKAVKQRRDLSQKKDQNLAGQIANWVSGITARRPSVEGELTNRRKSMVDKLRTVGSGPTNTDDDDQDQDQAST